jgi:NAD-dependent deacetylase
MDVQFSKEVIERLAAAQSVAVLTGAGISAESGVPTFRGEDGIWNKLKPEELASMDAFLKNPDLVWQWYQYRRELMNDIEPNPGHYVLAEMESGYDDFTLSTQNIDGLHIRAGSQRVLELHGNISRNRCNACDKLTDENFPGDKVARCQCGGLMRPDVVWFGEMLPQEPLYNSFAAAERADVYLSIGTSAVVQPAASLPLEAKHQGAFVVEINLERTEISAMVDESYLGTAGTLLPELYRLVKKERARENKD